ncbi:carboxypeptidase-like regulatory domain-containing protein [Methanocella sp. MCL-LM]|uniref:carboxypeptidase-like regulatory domain-containing protein n=1 Tax=Methanocella sp. MCL-LM TaxID=3412035 RepID=UPI003C70CA77
MLSVRPVTLALILLTALFYCSVAPGWAQSPFPDGIRFADTETSIPAGQNYSLVMQVLLDGGDYPRGSIGIYLVSNNSSVLDIPDSAMVATNQNGTAIYNLTYDQVKPGTAMVTAILLDKRTGTRVSKNYTIVNTGNITGIVLDSAGEPVPVAKVTLYQPVNGTMQIYPVAGNPTYSASNATGLPGSFSLAKIPYDTYYLEASFADQASGINYTLDGSGQPVNVTIAGYTIATPTPAATPTAVPSPTAAATATPAPAPTPSGDSSKQVLWIGGLAIVLAIVIVAIVLLTRKK